MKRDPRVDWAFVDARDAQTEIRRRNCIARRNLQALRKRVPETKFGPELADYLLANTRKRIPDADDRKEIALLTKQGFTASAISVALTLSVDIVEEVIRRP
jgi:hypothetical protein